MIQMAPEMAAKVASLVPGFMSTTELLALAEMAASADVIIEVGAWKGRTTVALGWATPGVVYAVDNWSGRVGTGAALEVGVWEEFAGHTYSLRAADKVKVCQGDSVEVSSSLPMANLVFIDADHTYEAAMADIAAYRPRVLPGGLLCGHDYYAEFPGVMRAVDEAFGSAVEVVNDTHIWLVRL